MDHHDVYAEPTLTSAFPEPTASDDRSWRTLVFLAISIGLSLGSLFLLYKFCIKDLLLTYRARRSRTITELGFGNTPIPPPARGNALEAQPPNPGANY